MIIIIIIIIITTTITRMQGFTIMYLNKPCFRVHSVAAIL